MSETNEKAMAGCWTNFQQAYHKNGFTIIYGCYYEEPKKIGVHWPDYPNTFGKLTPCVIPTEVANGMLSGLISEAIKMGDNDSLEKLQKAYRYINE